MPDVLDPTDERFSFKLGRVLARLGYVTLAAAVAECSDSGQLNGGDGGGNLVLVTCDRPHGLFPGDPVTLAGTGYDGEREVADVMDGFSFYLLDTPFVAPSSGGSWG